MGKRELVALLNLSSCVSRDVRAALPRGAMACLRFVIVLFYDHTYLLFLITYFVNMCNIYQVKSCSKFVKWPMQLFPKESGGRNYK